MKLQTWTPCTATPEGIEIEGQTFPWRDIPDFEATAPLVLIRVEGRPSGWASAPASIEQLSTLALEALTDGQTIEALRPGQALRRGEGAYWDTAPEVGL
ncbi:MAG: hypothetical protein JJ714_05015 [Acidithiobacillus sp.]|nr:hypothetical protein [Acidithiobacillus sp.]